MDGFAQVGVDGVAGEDAVQVLAGEGGQRQDILDDVAGVLLVLVVQQKAVVPPGDPRGRPTWGMMHNRKLASSSLRFLASLLFSAKISIATVLEFNANLFNGSICFEQRILYPKIKEEKHIIFVHIIVSVIYSLI